MTDRLWAPYDAMGPVYERHAADSPYNAHYDRPAVLEALGLVAGLRVLDAACGPGLYAEELVRAGADVVGFDASEAMLKLARARLGSSVRLDQARLGDRLPYDDGTFDAALCALAIHYADDRKSAYAELFRVLRPGGHLVVSTGHPAAEMLRLGGDYFATQLVGEQWGVQGRPLVRFWREPLSAVMGAATDAGFLLERLLEPRPAASMRDRYPDDYKHLSSTPEFLILRFLRPDRLKETTAAV